MSRLIVRAVTAKSAASSAAEKVRPEAKALSSDSSLALPGIPLTSDSPFAGDRLRSFADKDSICPQYGRRWDRGGGATVLLRRVRRSTNRRHLAHLRCFIAVG